MVGLRRLARLLKCKEMSRLISRREDGPLPLGTRVKMWFHMLFCDACRNFERQTVILRAAIRRYRE